MTTPAGLRERFYGWLSGWALVRVSHLAEKRGDAHEMRHVVAAVVAGNSNHDVAPCFLMVPEATTALESVRRGWSGARAEATP